MGEEQKKLTIFSLRSIMKLKVTEKTKNGR